MSRPPRLPASLTTGVASLMLTALSASASAAPMVLLVADFNNQTVRRYDETGSPLPSTGQPAGSAAFAQPPGGVDMTNTIGLATSGNNLFVSAYSSATGTHVVRFDLNTGAFLNTVVSSANTLNATDMMVGPDGLLYVGSDGAQAMLRFDQTGNPMPAPSRTGALFTGQGFLPRGILHRPQDGFYYMSAFGSNAIFRLDPLTGNATPIVSGGGSSLFGETLGPDGNLYFSLDNDIYKYTFATNNVSLFADVNGVFRLDFGPDRNDDGQLDLYHVSNDNRVRVVDGVTGAPLPDFIVTTGGLSAAINLQWVEVPEPAGAAVLAVGVVALIKRTRVEPLP